MKRNEWEDCHGRDILSFNEKEGSWAHGTPNAWVVVGDPDTSGCDEHGIPDGTCDGPDYPPATPTYFEVSGYRWGGEFTGYFVASSLERMKEWLLCHDVKDCYIITRKIRKTRRKYLPFTHIDLTDEQAAKLLGDDPPY